LKERRGVAGLISVIAIVIVFSMAAAAFLQLNAQQTHFVTSSSKAIELQGRRVGEQIVFDVTYCSAPVGNIRTVNMTANNMWSGRSQLDAVIFVSADKVIDAVYVTGVNATIPSLEKRSISLSTDDDVDETEQVAFVTKLGNKFSLLSSDATFSLSDCLQG
jgi:hypothetical protein